MNETNPRFCTECGEPVSGTRFCTSCGVQLAGFDAPELGDSLPPPVMPTQSARDRTRPERTKGAGRRFVSVLLTVALVAVAYVALVRNGSDVGSVVVDVDSRSFSQSVDSTTRTVGAQSDAAQRFHGAVAAGDVDGMGAAFEELVLTQIEANIALIDLGLSLYAIGQADEGEVAVLELTAQSPISDDDDGALALAARDGSMAPRGVFGASRPSELHLVPGQTGSSGCTAYGPPPSAEEVGASMSDLNDAGTTILSTPPTSTENKGIWDRVVSWFSTPSNVSTAGSVARDLADELPQAGKASGAIGKGVAGRLAGPAVGLIFAGSEGVVAQSRFAAEQSELKSLLDQGKITKDVYTIRMLDAEARFDASATKISTSAIIGTAVGTVGMLALKAGVAAVGLVAAPAVAATAVGVLVIAGASYVLSNAATDAIDSALWVPEDSCLQPILGADTERSGPAATTTTSPDSAAFQNVSTGCQPGEKGSVVVQSAAGDTIVVENLNCPSPGAVLEVSLPASADEPVTTQILPPPPAPNPCDGIQGLTSTISDIGNGMFAMRIDGYPTDAIGCPVDISGTVVSLANTADPIATLSISTTIGTTETVSGAATDTVTFNIHARTPNGATHSNSVAFSRPTCDPGSIDDVLLYGNGVYGWNEAFRMPVGGTIDLRNAIVTTTCADTGEIRIMDVSYVKGFSWSIPTGTGVLERDGSKVRALCVGSVPSQVMWGSSVSYPFVIEVEGDGCQTTTTLSESTTTSSEAIATVPSLPQAPGISSPTPQDTTTTTICDEEDENFSSSSSHPDVTSVANGNLDDLFRCVPLPVDDDTSVAVRAVLSACSAFGAIQTDIDEFANFLMYSAELNDESHITAFYTDVYMPLWVPLLDALEVLNARTTNWQNSEYNESVADAQRLSDEFSSLSNQGEDVDVDRAEAVTREIVVATVRAHEIPCRAVAEYAETIGGS